MEHVEFVRWCDEARQQLVLVQRHDFYDRISRDRIDRFERLDFHVVIHCTAGFGRHEVDFETVELAPGSALYIQPGQIHRLATGTDAEYDAHVMAFATVPEAPRPPAAGVNLVRLDEARRERLDLLYALARTRLSERPSELVGPEDSALRDLLYLAYGFHRVDRVAGGTLRGHPDWAVQAFVALRDDIERHLVAGETVQRRAARIGYSTRTLDRSCREIAGTTAKRVCDDRLALEARRLLSLPDASSVAVARRLGFSEPTNFTKFVKRTTGATPSSLLLS